MRNIVIDQKGCQLSYDRQLLLIKHTSFCNVFRVTQNFTGTFYEQNPFFIVL